MSGLERALLEGKERNELSQIAESLGKKPPARAKKADIVDLILTLAGVTTQGDEARGEEAPGDAARGDAAPGEAAGEAGPGTGATASSDPGSSADGTASDGDAARGDGAEVVAAGAARRDVPSGRGGERDPAPPASRPPAGPVERVQGPRVDREQGQDRVHAPRDDQNQGRDPGPRRDQGPGGPNPNGRDQGGADPNAKEPDGSGQGGDGDEPEEGNRRRRRRGRNRDGQADQLHEGEPIEVEGFLDLRDDGYGFLRLRGYLPSVDDVYVSVKQVRQFGLRKGDRVTGRSRPASRNEKNPALLQIDAVNGAAPDRARERRRFEELTPLFPDERLRLETPGAAATMTTRIIDLLAPIGKGQRGLIVSPPKAGKTTIMKQIARSIELNAPEVTLIVLLVDERPEEVTDMRRWLINGEVAASTFDRPSEEHIQVAELVIERAKRLVEDGQDVVIMLDGITRLARAYNLAAPPSGRIMSGGIDAAALYPPKRFFGAARNAEEGGSLTILATALVETGSKMDEHIFEEFKGTGNMELRLSRRLAERRVFPAIDVDASSTRHEELLFERRQVAQVDTLRKVLGAVKDGAAKEGGAPEAAALELLLDRLKTFKTNEEFLDEVGRARAGA